MSTKLDKAEACALVESLPEGSTWDDLMREIYERLAIKRGVEDADAGRVKDVGEIRRKYGLPE